MTGGPPQGRKGLALMQSVPRVTLRQLAYFLEVADRGGIRRAAEALNMSQPPLTQQIQALEHSIGARLFERERGGMALTAAGTALAEEAMRILAQVDEACARTRLVAAGAAGHLRVGLTEELIGSPPYAAILAFMAANPGVDVETHAAPSDALLRDMMDQRMDLALVNCPLVLNSDRFLSHPLPPTSIVAIVAADHPWAGRPAVPAAELAGQPLIMPPAWPATPLTLQTWRLAGQAGGRIDVAHTTGSGDIAIQLASRGKGIALLGANVAHRAGEAKVGIVRVDDPEARLAHMLITPARASGPAALALARCILGGDAALAPDGPPEL